MFQFIADHWQALSFGAICLGVAVTAVNVTFHQILDEWDDDE